MRKIKKETGRKKYIYVHILLCRAAINQSTFGEVTGKKADCLMCSVRLGTVLLKDEKLARCLQYSKKQLLLTVVASILHDLDNYQTGVDQF